MAAAGLAGSDLEPNHGLVAGVLGFAAGATDALGVEEPPVCQGSLDPLLVAGLGEAGFDACAGALAAEPPPVCQGSFEPPAAAAGFGADPPLVCQGSFEAPPAAAGFAATGLAGVEAWAADPPPVCQGSFEPPPAAAAGLAAVEAALGV